MKTVVAKLGKEGRDVHHEGTSSYLHEMDL